MSVQTWTCRARPVARGFVELRKTPSGARRLQYLWLQLAAVMVLIDVVEGEDMKAQQQTETRSVLVECGPRKAPEIHAK